MSQPVKISLVVSLGIILLLCCLLPLAWIGYIEYAHLTQPRSPVNPDTEGLIVTTGTMEVIVPQARALDEVYVSPTGRWLIFPTENTSHWFLLDTRTGQEHTLELGKYFDSETRWLNEKEFAAGYKIINAADLSSLQ